MTLFYAYLKDTNYDHVYRYLITFNSRETADEWWRLISTFPSPYVGKVKRITPQFYTQTAEVLNVATTLFTQPTLPDGKLYFERLFFTLLNDRDGRILSIAPPVEITDHVSGRWYFIRSKSNPQKYWYFRISGDCLVCGSEDCETIHVSAQYRSRFLIQVRNLSCKDCQCPKDLVMIRKDEVSIAASKDYTLRVNDADELVATKVFQIATSDLLFEFGDLKNRFVSRVEKQGDSERIWEYVVPVERGLGEEWELTR